MSIYLDIMQRLLAAARLERYASLVVYGDYA